MKQKQITFIGMNLKQIEFKPLINRLWHINEYNKNQFDIALKELDSAKKSILVLPKTKCAMQLKKVKLKCNPFKMI